MTISLPFVQSVLHLNEKLLMNKVYALIKILKIHCMK